MTYKTYSAKNESDIPGQINSCLLPAAQRHASFPYDRFVAAGESIEIRLQRTRIYNLRQTITRLYNMENETRRNIPFRNNCDAVTVYLFVTLVVHW